MHSELLDQLRNVLLFKILHSFSPAPNRFRIRSSFGTNNLRNMYLGLLEVHFQVPTCRPGKSSDCGWVDLTEARIWSTLYYRDKNSFLETTTFFFFFFSLGLEVECCDLLDSFSSSMIIMTSSDCSGWLTSFMSKSSKPKVGAELTSIAVPSSWELWVAVVGRGLDEPAPSGLAWA